MLLLTDNPTEGVYFQRILNAAQPCEMIDLEEAERHPATHTLIACHATLDESTSAKVHAALAHHRTDPRIPVLFLMDDASLYSSAQATALGATKAVPRGIAREELLFNVRKLVRASADVAAPKPTRSPAEGGIQEVGGTLQGMFRAAGLGHELPVAALEQAADTLLVSLKTTQLREWLDLVRRYDDMTYQHCLLVAGVVVAFASRLGLSAQHQRLLSRAALVHDVGKAVIPRRILNKPGILTAAEMTLMRTHPKAGHDMLAKQGGFDPVLLSVVMHHHEFLDGTGYPDRLKMGQISDFVRLVTICDIYAALIERRPYRAPMARCVAYETLRSMTGKLDAGLVESFGRVVDET